MWPIASHGMALKADYKGKSESNTNTHFSLCLLTLDAREHLPHASMMSLPRWTTSPKWNPQERFPPQGDLTGMLSHQEKSNKGMFPKVIWVCCFLPQTDSLQLLQDSSLQRGITQDF